MKPSLATFALALATTAQAITIDLGPPRIEKWWGSSHGATEFSFSDLDGLAFTQGNDMSIDLDFGGQFLQLWPNQYQRFSLLVRCRTDVETAQWFWTDSAGYTLGANGLPNSPLLPVRTYQAASAAFMGFDEPFNGVTPWPVYGLHLDFTPAFSGHFAAGSEFWIIPLSVGAWEIGPHVPDGGSGLALLFIGIGAIWFSLLYGRRKVSRNIPVDHIAEAHGFKGGEMNKPALARTNLDD